MPEQPARVLRLDLFCEDRGHEAFAQSVIERLCREEGVASRLVPRSAEGGHGRAISEFKVWQRAVASGLHPDRGDALVVLIDGNDVGWRETRRRVDAAIDRTLFPICIVGAPDPHIEAWCLADPVASGAVVGKAPLVPKRGRQRRDYKQHLRQALDDAGYPVLTDPMEYAEEFVERMALSANVT